MGLPAAALAAISTFVKQYGKKKAVEKFGTKRVRQAVEKEIKDKPSGSGRASKEYRRKFENEMKNMLEGKDAKKKAAELELDEIIPPMRFRKKGGPVKKSSPKKSSPKKSSPKKSIDGIARKGKTKGKNR